VRQRRRPLPYVLSGCATALLSPLLLLAALDGMIPGQIKEKRRKKKAIRARKAQVLPRLGLDRAFDGNWNATAGQLILAWYNQAPDPERLIVPVDGNLALLAAPSPWWYTGRPKHLRIVAQFPAGTARCEIPDFADDDNRRFWLHFPDGSWISLKAERGEQTARFFNACRVLPRE
jgi:hypothetical protein